MHSEIDARACVEPRNPVGQEKFAQEQPFIRDLHPQVSSPNDRNGRKQSRPTMVEAVFARFCKPVSYYVQPTTTPSFWDIRWLV